VPLLAGDPLPPRPIHAELLPAPEWNHDAKMMVDGDGVISAVIHGPDQRTRIRPETSDVFFAVYAPAGIEPAWVQTHLEDIRDNVLLISPHANVESLDVLP
jgi:hypothetical protein